MLRRLRFVAVAVVEVMTVNQVCPLCGGTGVSPDSSRVAHEREADLKYLREEFPGVYTETQLIARVTEEKASGMKYTKVGLDEGIALALAAFGKYLTK